MKKIILLLFMFLGVVGMTFAQRTISGLVSDTGGDPLIGANVLVENSTIGTITDIDGTFSLNVPDGTSSLVVSYTGFATQVVTLGASDYVGVELSEGSLLSEVVVTALGTKGNSRDVVYANQTVSSEDLNSSPNKNALEALRGKAAGVKITTASGSVGASNRIVLRGEGSLTGDNNALIVIDGVPIDNTATGAGAGGGDGTAQNGYADFGNRFNDLNPEDIESVTVLKGPSATALYGSRGASGVLVITTKSGAKGDGGLKVGLNSTYSVQEAYVQLERQDQYGQGYDNLHFDSGENWSWGPAFDGVVRPWTSPVDVDGDGALEALTRPYSAVPNQLQDFFRQGSTLNNSVSLSGSKDGFSYYGSYSNLKQEGILDNTTYDRNTLNFKATAKLSDRLTSSFGVNYAISNTNTAQEGYRPFDGQNAYANAVQSPVNIPNTEIRDYQSPFHDLSGFYGSYSVNPYYILNEFTNEGTFNNFLGTFNLNYKVFDNFSLNATIGMNKVSGIIESTVPKYQYEDQLVWVDDLQLASRGGRLVSPGEYAKTNINNSNVNAKILGLYNRNLNKDFTLDLTGGTEIFDRRADQIVGLTRGGLVLPGWYNFSNSVQTAQSTQSSSKYRLVGILGNAKVGYKNSLFLEYSARNDWSSTLPADNNSFFYQAIGASAVLSDLLEINTDGPVEFLKVRGSVGTTGKDAPLSILETPFIGNPVFQTLTNHDLTSPLNGQPATTVDGLIGNPNLRPELTTTYEFGVDARFFEGRINLGYTYYQSVHSDQIIQIGLSPSSGYASTYQNIGEMINKGHEVSLNLRPISGLVDGLTWNVGINFATNDNEVTKVSDEADEIVIGGPYTNGSVSLVAKEGLPFGTFRSTVPKTTADGIMLVDDSGIPILTDAEEYHGSYQADYTLGLGTSIGYKGFTINALVDIRQGGNFFSITKNQSEFNGTALSTLLNDREPFILPNTMEELADGELIENTHEVTAQDLYAVSDVYFGGGSLIIDASFVKLREIGISYDLASLLKKNDFPISNATIGLFANNLKFWLPEENTYADPEINGPSLTGNATGVETTQTPPARTFGVRLGLTF